MTKKKTEDPAKKQQEGSSLISTISALGVPPEFEEDTPVEERLYHLDGTEDEA